ncbi:MAG: DNA-binding protein [Candidatus Omnitrophica bacterium]|nr:DNA-binding protein [Candidatus Omnitrophota bacterium]
MKNKVHSLRFTVYSILFALLTVNCTLYTFCYAQIISSSELINNAKEYDGKVVTFEGEVIGDVMVRGDFAWVNLSDISNAIGIWMPADLARQIAYTGSYKSKGDALEVAGTFHRACPEHGGDLDIHALSLRKTDAGRLIKERVNQSKKVYVFILLGVLGLAWILTLLKHK